MTLGLAIGKFHPPHRGHRHLIETGRSRTDDMLVIVCAHPGQRIPAPLRAAWIEEMVPGVRTLIVDDVVPADDSKGWADYTRRVLGRAPDIVFTSEDYGDAYARHLGSTHVCVDRERRVVPVSASVVRRDPLQAWDFLDPCVRAYFARRVCLVGAESTGKTTLATRLAAHYRTVWVPEYGRDYAERKLKGPEPKLWRTSEFVHIAREQNRLEDRLARTCDRLLVCDTDSFATTLWHERYIGTASAEVAAIAADRRPDLYLLGDVTLPFVQDGTRDGEHIRHAMHRRFEEELSKRGVRWGALRGDAASQWRTALDACDDLLRQVRPLE
jgi:HTH-type transcriptional regulator, transcriptional repressor of NAD biosynthesis genes